MAAGLETRRMEPYFIYIALKVEGWLMGDSEYHKDVDSDLRLD